MTILYMQSLLSKINDGCCSNMPRTLIKTVFGWHGTSTPVLQYSSEFKHSRHDSLWTHGCVDRNGIVLDTTEILAYIDG
jgi:hypothetical protein